MVHVEPEAFQGTHNLLKNVTLTLMIWGKHFNMANYSSTIVDLSFNFLTRLVVWKKVRSNLRSKICPLPIPLLVVDAFFLDVRPAGWAYLKYKVSK